MKANSPRQPENKVLMEHNRTFMSLFKDEVLKDSTKSETLKWLANGLKFHVLCCTESDINNFSFNTKSLNEKKYSSKYWSHS